MNVVDNDNDNVFFRVDINYSDKNKFSRTC